MILISAPISIVIALIYLYSLLGWSALVGFACMAITFSLPARLLVLYSRVEEKVLKRTDERVGIINELLNNVRVIKYFGWENAIIKRVDDKRDHEQNMIWKGNTLRVDQE